jgi:hypothetical protein
MSDFLPELIKEEEERNYLSGRNFELDMDMITYGVKEESGFELDWSKLIYGNEQMLEKLLLKEEERLPSSYYNYLFKKPYQRSPMEKHILKQRAIKVDDSSTDEEESELEKRLTIMYMESIKQLNQEETKE